MLNDAKLFKKEILQIKDKIELAYFMKDNKIEPETDDKELIEHFTKYLSFGSLEDKENGIIFDLRNRKKVE